MPGIRPHRFTTLEQAEFGRLRTGVPSGHDIPTGSVEIYTIVG